jgi:hypothetical protein
MATTRTSGLNRKQRREPSSTVHWRPLVNSTAADVPTVTSGTARRPGGVRRDPDTAWKFLASSGATLVVVHEGHSRVREAGRLAGC